MNFKRYIIIVVLFWGLFANNMTICAEQKALPWSEDWKEAGLPHYMAWMPYWLSNFDMKYSLPTEAGIWALTPPVAIHYGLRIDEVDDERYDVKLATRAAIAYMRDLLDYWKSEDIAAFVMLNGSAIVVEVAHNEGIDLRSMSGEEVVRLGECLPSFRRGYITTKTLMMAQAQCNISDSLVAEYNISDQEREARLAEKERVREELRAKERAEAEAAALARAKAEAEAAAGRTYVVKSGDTLGGIAMRYHVTISQIKKWNHLRSDLIRIGQRIKIYK